MAASSPSRRFKALLPLLAFAGVVAAAVWFGSAPVQTPSVVDRPSPFVPPVAADPLPSWNDGPTKRAILEFLDKVTREGADTFVPVAERVAVFDHDGTLVCEKPIVHGMFLLDRIRHLAEQRPDLGHEEPFATLLTGDIESIRKLGRKYLIDLTFSVLAGMPEDRLEESVREFLTTARHPAFGVPYADTTYQPMHELLAALRSRGFTIWICSGSGLHFMRPAAAAWYGIEPDRVIASRPRTEMREIDDGPSARAGSPNRRLGLVVLPELEVLNDRENKPVGIGEHIGRRPIFAAGNVGTEGDIAMLRWSQSSARPSLQLLVHHDDADREMAYDEPSNASLDAAERYGWHVVRMASDWNRVFAKPLSRGPVPAAAVPTSPPATPPAGPAASSASTGPPPVRWEEEVAAYAAVDRDQPATPGGICFIGSSNIRGWAGLADDFPGMNVVNRGVNGALLSDLAAFAPRLVAAAKPALVVVSAGTNDVAAGATADDVVASFRRLVANVRESLPDVKIAFLSISPSILRWDQFDRQQQANAAIRECIASGAVGEGLDFIDVDAAFLGPDGTPAAECFADDRQHPSAIGNGRRAAIMRPRVEALLGR
jgi:phosphoserine phosphatase/lysophospholipase L1-like esterase